MGSVFIIAVTAVGAGMFSMPVATSGMCFIPSLFMLFFVWYCMYSAALYVLEAKMRFPLGATFDTIAQGIMGHTGRIINDVSIGFVCYILTYAYISGGGSITSYMPQSVADVTL
ncbi:hypothetical protein N9V90_00080 [Endozoicomonas sp.]|nr:hypothetical protein [Endozoicomonas sp.]